MHRTACLMLGICLVVLVASPERGECRGRRRGAPAPMEADVLGMGTQFDWGMFESPWGPGPFLEYGSFAPTSGSWDELLKSGPTAAVGVRWKYADFSGDILPPSSTYFTANYRYAFMKGDDDVQVYGPNGFVGDVENMRINMLQFGVNQRFMGPSRRGLFVDVGCAFGLGGADGTLVAATPDPNDEPVFVTERNEDSFLMRSELNGGIGLQFSRVDMRFGVAAGLNGASALSGGYTTHGDFGCRIGGTLYLFD